VPGPEHGDKRAQRRHARPVVSDLHAQQIEKLGAAGVPPRVGKLARKQRALGIAAVGKSIFKIFVNLFKILVINSNFTYVYGVAK
jgi:hypothetical protein